MAGDAKTPIIKTEVKLVETVEEEPDLRQARRHRGDGGTSTSHVTLIESALNIKSGERTVVGVSKLDGGDKGLILIISGKVID